MFTPPHGALRRAVILATDCEALESRRQVCEAVPGVAAARCVAVNGEGEPPRLQIVEREGVRRLRFQFPDTDDLLADADDDLTLAGPAAIAVTGVGDPLPCGLATGPCATRSGLVACVDELFVDDGACGMVVEGTFSHFTALPPANHYQAICVDPAPPCTGSVDDLRFAVDAAGNVLVPMDWRGILVERDAVPVARLLRASTSLEAFEGGGVVVCAHYPDTAPSDGIVDGTSVHETALRIFHQESNNLVDRTTSLDIIQDQVCATVSSLSPFALAAIIVGFVPPDSPTLSCERLAVKNVSKLASAVLRCNSKAAQAGFAGKTRNVVSDCEFEAQTKYNEANAKLEQLSCRQLAPCMMANLDAVRDQVQAALEGTGVQLFCTGDVPFGF